MRKRTASGKSTSCWRFSIGFRIIKALFHMISHDSFSVLTMLNESCSFIGSMSIVGVTRHNESNERACTRVCALSLCAGGAEEKPVAGVLKIAEAEANAFENLFQSEQL